MHAAKRIDKVKKFTGKCVQVFKQGINQYENNNNKLLGMIARVHEYSVKKAASYIKRKIVFNEAKDCKCKYTFILQTDSRQTDAKCKQFSSNKCNKIK